MKMPETPPAPDPAPDPPASPAPQAASDPSKPSPPPRSWFSLTRGLAGFVLLPLWGSGLARATGQNWRELAALTNSMGSVQETRPARRIAGPFAGLFAALRANVSAAVALLSAPPDPQHPRATHSARKAAAFLQITLTLAGLLLAGTLLGTVLVHLLPLLGDLLTLVLPQAFAQTAQAAGSAAGSGAPLSALSDVSLAPDALTEKLWEKITGLTRGQGALSSLIGAVNLFFCAIFALLLLAKGLVIPADTAGSGRMMVSKYWIIRLAFALFLIYPGLTPGINGGQTAILKLAQWGGALGAKGWTLIAESWSNEDDLQLMPALPDAFSAVISNLVLDETCMYLANVVALRAGDPPYVTFTPPVPPTRPDLPGHVGEAYDRAVRSYSVTARYDGTGPGLPGGLCGSYTLLIDDHDSAAERTALAAHIAALNAILPKAHALARTIGDHFIPGSQSYAQPLPDIDPLLEDSGIYDLYTRRLAKGLAPAPDLAAREQAARRATFLKRQGWMAAGAWALRFAQSNRRFAVAYDAFPKVTPPLPRARDISDILATALPKTAQWLNNSRHPVTVPGLAVQGTGRLADALRRGQIDFDSLILFDFLAPDLSGDPLGALIVYGQSILDWWKNTIIGLTGLVSGSGLLKAIPWFGDGLAGGVSGAWSVIGPFFTGLMTLLAIAGATLAWLLPFLPYALFIMGIALWMQAGLIALVAVNLLALALLDHREPRPLPREVRIALLLMLRFVAMPILMLLGLMLGLVMINALLGLNTRFFHDLIAPGIQGGGAISQIAWTVLYTALSYGIANAGFKLITRLPLEAFALIGARSGLFTEESHGSGGVFARFPGMGTGRGGRPPGGAGARGGTMNKGP